MGDDRLIPEVDARRDCDVCKHPTLRPEGRHWACEPPDAPRPWKDTAEVERRERARDAARYVDLLWSGLEGWVAIGVGLGGCFNDEGSYEFTEFRQTFLRWPDDRDSLLAGLVEAGPTVDVFVGPALRAEQSRKKHTSAPSRWAWCDYDAPWDEGLYERLEPLEGRVAVIDSGRGCHVYLRLDDLAAGAELESWNRRLGALCGSAADAGWSDTKVLRLPGTFNHKPRAAGRESTPVAWRWSPCR